MAQRHGHRDLAMRVQGMFTKAVLVDWGRNRNRITNKLRSEWG